jgi:hypothetical protein
MTDKSPHLKAIEAGKYRHFKGREYEVLHTAKHSETEEVLVIYRPLYGEKELWARPLSMFLETITRDGEQMTRFQKID